MDIVSLPEVMVEMTTPISAPLPTGPAAAHDAQPEPVVLTAFDASTSFPTRRVPTRRVTVKGSSDEEAISLSSSSSDEEALRDLLREAERAVILRSPSLHLAEMRSPSLHLAEVPLPSLEELDREIAALEELDKEIAALDELDREIAALDFPEDEQPQITKKVGLVDLERAADYDTFAEPDDYNESDEDEVILDVSAIGHDEVYRHRRNLDDAAAEALSSVYTSFSHPRPVSMPFSMSSLAPATSLAALSSVYTPFSHPRPHRHRFHRLHNLRRRHRPCRRCHHPRHPPFIQEAHIAFISHRASSWWGP